MTEKQAKKLGEVYAFATVGVETFERGENALRKGYGDEFYDDYVSKCKDIISFIDNLGKDQDISKVVSEKAQKTHEKLSKMRDLYLGDEWDDPIEHMEWMGFFEGAAIVHWSLIQGVNTELSLDELSEVIHDALNLHERALAITNEKIRENAPKA